MGFPENRGTPKSSILIGFSSINHPFWGTPIFGNTHISVSSIGNIPKISRSVIQLLQVRQRNSSHLRLVVSSKCSHGEDGMERNKLRIGERGGRFPWGVHVAGGVTVPAFVGLLIDSLGILAWGRKPMVCKVGSMFKLSEVLWVKKLCFLYILFKLEIISFTGY